MTEHVPFNATVTGIDRLNDATILLRAELDDGGRLDFVPGQFVNLGLPPRRPDDQPGKEGLVKRPYSIASAPKSTQLEFFLRLVDDGALTPALFALDVGDRIWIESRAIGKFTLASLPESPAPAERDLVMVSTGTGLAPFQSMLREFDGLGQWRRFVMINGVRIESDLGYRGELERKQAEDDNFVYIPLCSREPEGSGWTGLRGRVQEALEPATYERLVGAPLDPACCQVMLCGNPDMIDGLEADLTGRGFKRHRRKEPGQLHLERYW
ncbi:MAG: ferredoxin--NADP reductase [Planctomycetota bacterium]|jgi:ferredoxin--NADP+ reductase